MAKKQKRAHSFFKAYIIITDDSAHPFVVPPAYVKAVGGALPDKYNLIGPNGDIKVVEVNKNGLNKWFFRGGWRPFIKDYSLKFGDLLFFTLDHNACTSTAQKLHVQVYEMNGYPKKITGSTSIRSFIKKFSRADVPIRVPSPYVNASGGAFAVKYKLRGPNGEYRIVEVEKEIGGCWFLMGGWGPFEEKWPLVDEDILVFTFHSHDELHFQVFDRNGYLKKSSNDFEDEEMIEISSSFSDSPKGPSYEKDEEVESKPVGQSGDQGPSDAAPRFHCRRARSMRNRRKISGDFGRFSPLGPFPSSSFPFLSSSTGNVLPTTCNSKRKLVTSGDSSDDDRVPITVLLQRIDATVSKSPSIVPVMAPSAERMNSLKSRDFHHEKPVYKEHFKYSGLKDVLEGTQMYKHLLFEGFFYPSLVREFYCNLDDQVIKDHKIHVRKYVLPFSAEVINGLLGTPNDAPWFQCLVDEVDMDKVTTVITGGQLTTWPSDNGHDHCIPADKLTAKAFVLFKLSARNWLPTTHTCNVYKTRAVFTFAIMEKCPFNLGQLILDTMVKVSTCRNSKLYFPYLISKFCSRYPFFKLDKESKEPIKGYHRISKKIIKTPGRVMDLNLDFLHKNFNSKNPMATTCNAGVADDLNPETVSSPAVIIDETEGLDDHDTGGSPVDEGVEGLPISGYPNSTLHDLAEVAGSMADDLNPAAFMPASSTPRSAETPTILSPLSSCFCQKLVDIAAKRAVLDREEREIIQSLMPSLSRG